MTLQLEFQRLNRLRKLEQADRTRLQSSGAWRLELGLVYLDLSTYSFQSFHIHTLF